MIAVVRRAAVAVFVALLVTAAGLAPARAHTMSDGYLDLAVDGAVVRGQLDLAARDLHDALVLDHDGDGRLRWREVIAGGDRIRAYVRDHLGLAAPAGACAVTAGELTAIDRADGVHVAVALTARCPGPADPLTIDYRAIFAVDARHSGLVHLHGAGGSAATVIRGPGPVTLATGDGASVLGFVREGVWHIWIGFDHVCFLLALLLPSVLRRGAAGWQPRDRLRDVLGEVFGVVTAFTLAHSITLIAAALGWVALPARLIETTIALSVAAAALANLVRGLDTRWAFAFVLGLVHGFGFSGVLTELGLPTAGLVPALLGFNLGVELGQAAIVVVFVPVAFALRRTRLYRVVLVLASLAMASIALSWAFERAFS